MPSYGPMFFDMPPGDHIPSIPWGDRPRPDPNRRPAQALIPPNVAEWAASRPRWTFSVSKGGELESRSYMLTVDPDEINAVISEARRKHGDDAIKVIILHLAPEALEGRFYELRFYGYERCEARESKDIPELIFVTDKPRLWKR